VIELETLLSCAKGELAAKEREADVLSLELADATTEAERWQEKHEHLEQEIADEAAERPAIPYADWYYMLHPRAGGEPDLRVIHATRHDRIIA
jgi:hypothetical protein